jgi:hypothetical protein
MALIESADPIYASGLASPDYEVAILSSTGAGRSRLITKTRGEATIVFRLSLSTVLSCT